MSSNNWAIKLDQSGDTEVVGYTQYNVLERNTSYVAPIGTWVHLAFVHNGSSVKLFVNGVQTDRHWMTMPLPLDRLGYRSQGSDHIRADIDEVKVFDATLTRSQVRSVYNEN